jgi:hypothetical protein
MPHDSYGHEHSTQSTAAISAFELATRAVAAHQPVGDALARALAADPDCVSAIALRSLGAALLAREETMHPAAADARSAEAALHRTGGGTESERALVAAARLASGGQLQSAALALETYLAGGARDFLAAKAAHALRFMCGQPQRMLAVTGLLLSGWRESDPGYGFLLGCHAFGLEEVGRFREAETAGRKAVACEPADAWGLHAVSHVMEMTGRTEDGVAWLEASRPVWPACNNFRFHLAWHLALFHLENGDHDAALALYDREVMPAPSDDFRDMANAVSLLWRLRQSGLDVGSRWNGLREVALKRQADTTHVFASLHYLMALVATGERDAARRLISSVAARADAGADEDQAIVARDVGIAMAGVIAGAAGGAGCSLARLAPMLGRLGGSNAQRDVFMRTLILAARDDGDTAALRRISRTRALLRKEDRFASCIAASRTVADMRGAA